MKHSVLIREVGKNFTLGVLSLALAWFGLQLLFSGARYQTIAVSDYSLTGVEYSPGGRILAVTGGAHSWKGRWISSSDLLVRLYDPSDGRLLHELDGHTRFVRSCSFSPDGSRLLTVSRELLLWNPETGELLKRIDPGERTVLLGQFLAGGDRFVTGTREGTVQIWDAGTGEVLKEFNAHDRALTALDAAATKDIFATGTVGEVFVWDADTGEKIDEFPVEYVPVSIKFTDQDRTLLVPNGSAVVARNLVTQEERLLTERQGSWVGNIAVSADGVYLATTSTGGEVQIWTQRDMKRQARLPRNGSDCFGLSLSPGGTQLAAVGMNGELRLWELAL